MRVARSTSIRRAVARTRSMTVEHLDNLAKELIKNKIMTNAQQISPGEWSGEVDESRVFNLDETPQSINFENNGSSPRLFYCPKREACQKLINENREIVTITPIVSLAGSKIICQGVFAFKTGGITSSMAPKSTVENKDNLLISTTEKGYQD